MDQPLWQNYLNSIFLALAVLPAGTALALGVPHPAQRVACIAVCVACAIAAVAIWGKRAWVIGSLALVAFTFVVATLAALALAPSGTHAAWLAQLVIILVAAAWLILLAHREGEHDRHA